MQGLLWGDQNASSRPALPGFAFRCLLKHFKIHGLQFRKLALEPLCRHLFWLPDPSSTQALTFFWSLNASDFGFVGPPLASCWPGRSSGVICPCFTFKKFDFRQISCFSDTRRRLSDSEYRNRPESLRACLSASSPLPCWLPINSCRSRLISLLEFSSKSLHLIQLLSNVFTSNSPRESFSCNTEIVLV